MRNYYKHLISHAESVTTSEALIAETLCDLSIESKNCNDLSKMAMIGVEKNRLLGLYPTMADYEAARNRIINHR